MNVRHVLSGDHRYLVRPPGIITSPNDPNINLSSLLLDPEEEADHVYITEIGKLTGLAQEEEVRLPPLKVFHQWDLSQVEVRDPGLRAYTVSYTHLTLPTILRV